MNTLKRKILILLPFVLFFSFVSCKSETVSYVSYTADDDVKFDIPSSWKDSSQDEDSPYDRMFISKGDLASAGISVYYKDSEEKRSNAEFFKNQVDEMMSGQKPKVISEQKVRELQDKTITDVAYSGISGASKFYFIFSLVEFKGRDDIFAIWVQVSKPVVFKKYKPILEKIVNSSALV
ncbi:MAG: hypothetical protein FWC57_00725 [Endomicrobia bacterium]|nr:hypothetical protein [Endomicrobiia bacterium]